jgi:hypothetical protein
MVSCVAHVQHNKLHGMPKDFGKMIVAALLISGLRPSGWAQLAKPLQTELHQLAGHKAYVNFVIPSARII